MVGLWLSACTQQPTEEKTNPSKAVKVTTYQVQKVSQLQQLVYTANIEADNTTKVGFALPGVVNNVVVQEGQFVKQGQLLASIDATEYENALAIGNASLEQAEDLYARLNELYQKGSLPAKDYMDIKTKLAQARASRSINMKHIADSKLYAPISGIVTEKLIERGSTAGPGMPAFTIIKTDKVYAKITVPESEIGVLQKGMTATVSIATLQDSLKGTISIVNPQADANAKTYAVKILLANPEQRLLPGMLAKVQIETGKPAPVIAIPAKAVVRDEDELTYVYIVNGKNMAVRKRVSVGSLTGRQEAVILDGLASGEKIVVEGQSNLRDGALVSF